MCFILRSLSLFVFDNLKKKKKKTAKVTPDADHHDNENCASFHFIEKLYNVTIIIYQRIFDWFTKLNLITITVHSSDFFLFLQLCFICFYFFLQKYQT